MQRLMALAVVVGFMSFECEDARAALPTPTYSHDIAPILWKNCAGCHRPGEIGPFSLLTYKDAAKRADFLGGSDGERQHAAVEARGGLWVIS